jgi:hypothetical protein
MGKQTPCGVVTRGQIDPAKVEEGKRLSQAFVEAVKKQPAARLSRFMNLGTAALGDQLRRRVKTRFGPVYPR